MAVDVRWTQSPTIIGGNIRTRRERAGSALLTLCKSHGARGESAMRSRAPWNDQTGNARQGLFNEVHAGSDVIEIVFGGTAEYQKYLELGTSRAAARPIIVPVTHEVAAQVTTDAAKVVKGLFG